jgi:hypothetical protein
MSTSGLFDTMFDVLAGSPHYMVTGSLSFLPLTPDYRAPGEDLDVFIRRDVFEGNRRAFENAGVLRVLRVPEVAVAGTSLIAKAFVPRTGFVHLETNEGVLDVVLYEEDDISVALLLGLGVRFCMTRAFSARRRELRWPPYRYSAAPPEFMFLTKAVGYALAWRDGTAREYEQTKHYADLLHMTSVIDWGFALELLRSLHVRWGRLLFPGWVETHVNPYAIVDLHALKQALERGRP